ncbi:endonuclease/exonuclease/phosphatase family protein [Xylariales sp. PMI_506]|nr:endonuclease/exonuclease/phosphatase family protein [Xylariales sp. PMI_506]
MHVGKDGNVLTYSSPNRVGDGSTPLQLRVISHNVRYAATSRFKNEQPWSERVPLILTQLQHETRPINITAPGAVGAFIGLQEVLHKQLVDILVGLNKVEDHHGSNPPQGPLWAHIGVGRDDGKTAGEYSTIIYPVNLFKVLHEENIWLSPTPDRPSKGWDAGNIRILTIGVFEHKPTGRRLIAANTHLDNEGSRSRFESVGIILKSLKRIRAEWSRDGEPGLAIFLTGDFNSFPTKEAYQAIKGSGYLKDLYDEIDAKDHYGETDTFSGFEPEKQRHEQGRIDYIWLGPDEEATSAGVSKTPWVPGGYAVLPNLFKGGIYLSDHRAVVGDFTLL